MEREDVWMRERVGWREGEGNSGMKRSGSFRNEDL